MSDTEGMSTDSMYVGSWQGRVMIYMPDFQETGFHRFSYFPDDARTFAQHMIDAAAEAEGEWTVEGITEGGKN